MADENLPREELLRKMLKMTTSDNDNIALTAIRKANELLRAGGWDWDKFCDAKIRIVENPFANLANPREKQNNFEYTPPAKRFRPRTPMPSHSPGPGYIWDWDSSVNMWMRATDPFYQPKPKTAGAQTSRMAGLGLTRDNMYEGHCHHCGTHVTNKAGYIGKLRDICGGPDKWAIFCNDCNKNVSSNVVRSAAAPKHFNAPQGSAPLGNL